MKRIEFKPYGYANDNNDARARVILYAAAEAGIGPALISPILDAVGLIVAIDVPTSAYTSMVCDVELCARFVGMRRAYAFVDANERRQLCLRDFLDAAKAYAAPAPPPTVDLVA